jgi:hypothetical protein
MQVTRAAFQAVASLNKQATDPKSHTLVSNFYTRISLVPLPAIPMVDPLCSLLLLAPDRWRTTQSPDFNRRPKRVDRCCTVRRAGAARAEPTPEMYSRLTFDIGVFQDGASS